MRLSGLDPSQISGDWEVLERGIRTWIDSKHLETILLEVYNPKTDALIGRWDIYIAYTWQGENGRFWVDTDQIKAAIMKAGVWPGNSKYRIVCSNKGRAPRSSRLVINHVAFHIRDGQAEPWNNH